MIIECINCNKKFEVKSELIPSSGRTIQCGVCNHIWFFNPKTAEKVQTTNQEIDINQNTGKQKNDLFNKNLEKKQKKSSINKDAKIINSKKSFELTKYNQKKGFSLTKFLSYILVLIITFIAIIIVIDTFKKPIYLYFPKIELILFNFFETLKDIELFIKDLI